MSADAGVLATIGWGYTSTNGLLFRQNGGQFGVSKWLSRFFHHVHTERAKQNAFTHAHTHSISLLTHLPTHLLPRPPAVTGVAYMTGFVQGRAWGCAVVIGTYGSSVAVASRSS